MNPSKIFLQKNKTTDLYDDFWPEWFEGRNSPDDVCYIDAERLKTEVKNWLNKQMGFAWDAVNEVLKIIDSLQQDNKEDK